MQGLTPPITLQNEYTGAFIVSRIIFDDNGVSHPRQNILDDNSIRRSSSYPWSDTTTS